MKKIIIKKKMRFLDFSLFFMFILNSGIIYFLLECNNEFFAHIELIILVYKFGTTKKLITIYKFFITLIIVNIIFFLIKIKSLIINNYKKTKFVFI